MSKAYIGTALRSEVIKRAGGCCEYCLADTRDSVIDFAIDHIIAEKHGGPTQSDNLCLSCYWCNSFKGSDLSSVDWENDGVVTPLFNPRKQNWSNHFRLDELQIMPMTATGRVTVYLLQINSSERLKERRLLVELGVYPCKQD